MPCGLCDVRVLPYKSLEWLRLQLLVLYAYYYVDCKLQHLHDTGSLHFHYAPAIHLEVCTFTGYTYSYFEYNVLDSRKGRVQSSRVEDIDMHI